MIQVILLQLVAATAYGSTPARLELHGGAGTGPYVNARELVTSFVSRHPDEVDFTVTQSGGSKALAALVGDVDCVKKFKGHPTLCSTPPVENATTWGAGGLSFPGSWYTTYADLDLQLLPSLAGPICLVYSKDVTGSLGSTDDPELNMTLEVAADIMGGLVRYWDDGALQSLNPGLTLPHERISVVVRSDKSSLNEAVTKSLNRSSPWWSQVPGFLEQAVGKQPKWPLSNYTDGNDTYYVTQEGQESMMVDALRKPFSFTYVDLTQVRRFSEVIGSAHIVSSFNGKPVAPTQGTVSNALMGAIEKLPANDSKLEVQALDVQSDMAYPIVRVTYWYIKKAAAANGDCYRTWLLKEFLLFSYSAVAAEIADRNGWIVPPASVLDLIFRQLAEMRCVDPDTGQQVLVEDYQPPRNRQCPRGQHIQRSESGSGAAEFTGCGKCPAGTYQPRDMEVVFSCLPCSVGSATNRTGQGECQLCPAGRSSGTPGAETCMHCPAGKYSPSNGGSQCFDCPLGTSTLGKVAAQVCEQCPLGRFGNETALGACHACPVGQSTRQPGQESGLACGCEPSYFLDSRGQCERCPLGLECPGFGSPLRAAPGYMLLAGDESAPAPRGRPPEAYKCQPVHACPGGPPGTCAQGRVGLACGGCPEDHYMHGATGCHQCDGKHVAGILLAVWLVVVLILPIVLFCYSRFEEPGDSGPGMEIIAAKGIAIVIIRFVQFMGLISLLTIPWPQSISSSLGHFDLFLLNQDRVPNLSCLASSPWQRFAFVASTMPVALSVLGVCACARRHHLVRSSTCPWETSSLINAVGSLLFISFTPLAITALRPMMCYSHPGGSKSLLEFPSVLCGDGQHHNMLVLAVPLLVLVLCFLAYVLKSTWQAPSRVIGADDTSSRAFLHSSRYLFQLYRSDRWYWGATVLPRGLLLSLVPVLLSDTPGTQVLVFAVITLVVTSTQVAHQPWRHPLLNALDESAGVLQLCFLVVVGVAFVPSIAVEVGDGSSLSLYTFLMTSFCVLPVVIAALSGGVVLAAVRQKMKQPTTTTQLDWLERHLLSTPPDMLELGSALAAAASKIGKFQPDALISHVSAMEAYDVRTLANSVVVLSTFSSTEVDDVHAQPKRSPSLGRGFPPRIVRRTSSQGTASSTVCFEPVLPHFTSMSSDEEGEVVAVAIEEPIEEGELPNAIS